MSDTTATPALIDAAEFARLLSVSKPTIWRLREAGKLPPAIALTSQCIRWRRDRVLGWIDEGCPAGGAVLPNAAERVATTSTV
ncbi:MAG: helix-turn-helix domain-containing protein [Planctomycetaceae bacterium]|nr:helix-turn-helix domain-containing protein [Planctomycetaceae bacterium]